MHEYDYDYARDRKRGPSWPIEKVHGSSTFMGYGPVLFWLVMAIILFSLFGCAGLSTQEVVETVATEVAEAAPIVASNPTMPGLLTAIVSVVAGLAGAGLGAEAKKRSVKKKIAEGVLGKRAKEQVESL